MRVRGLLSSARIYFTYIAHIGRFGLSGRIAKADFRPQALFKGDAALGKAIMDQRFTFLHHSENFDGDWNEDAPDAWKDELARFQWINDVVAFSNTKLAAARVRTYIQAWIDQPEMRPAYYSSEITGQRVCAWLENAMFILAGAPVSFRRIFLRQIARDALRLKRSIRSSSMSFEGLRGLIYAALCLPGFSVFLPLAIAHLRALIMRSFYGDGSHKSRSPRIQLESLRSLVCISNALARAKQEMHFLQPPIERAALALRVLLQGDGRLSLFNDSLLGNAQQIEQLLQKTNVDVIVPDSTASGFYRLARGESVVVLDGAAATHNAFEHDEVLSFEMSDGAQRVIVNCGAYRGVQKGWANALKRRAAHSTVNCGRNDTPIHNPDAEVDMHFGKANDTMFVDTDYEGLRGCRYKRGMALSEDGLLLQGNERLEAFVHTASILPVDLRFHLHPAVAVAQRDDLHIEIALPGGHVWNFEASQRILLEETVYLGEDGSAVNSTQICIRGVVDHLPWECSWRMQRADFS